MIVVTRHDVWCWRMPGFCLVVVVVVVGDQMHDPLPGKCNAVPKYILVWRYITDWQT
jgi:hypothetical protein